MKRVTTKARDSWQKTVEGQGFPFHTNGKRPEGDTYGTYWFEEAYYEFTAGEVDELEAATNELHQMCLKAVEHVAADPSLMVKLGIPLEFHTMIRDSIYEDAPALYGRFDLAYDGVSPPKMLEYNADTPTTLIESSIVQWFWKEDKFKDADQFNSIHERLIERWRELRRSVGNELVYFSANRESLEEFATCEYIRDTAYQAGIESAFLNMADIGYDGDHNVFVDLNEEEIHLWFKLYPWEWLVKEDFGKHLIDLVPFKLSVIEPPWKMLLSNKGLLPVLWKLYPGHKYLLEAYFEDEMPFGTRAHGEWVSKPLLGREGANIRWYKDAVVVRENVGAYDGPRVTQAAAKLPSFDGNYVVLGSWVVSGESAGMIVREDTTPIIVDRSRVVPHIFR